MVLLPYLVVFKNGLSLLVGHIPLWLKDGTYVPAKEKGKPAPPYQKVKKFETDEEDWNDAYFYYKVAMDLGWRAEEAFTAGCNKIKEDDKEEVFINDVLYRQEIQISQLRTHSYFDKGSACREHL